MAGRLAGVCFFAGERLVVAGCLLETRLGLVGFLTLTGGFRRGVETPGFDFRPVGFATTLVRAVRLERTGTFRLAADRNADSRLARERVMRLRSAARICALRRLLSRFQTLR